MARLVLGNKFARASKERPWLQRLAWRIEAAIIVAGLRICSLMPVDRASAFGRRAMERLGPRLAKHRKFKEVLRVAFPGRSEAELEQLTVGIWGNVGASMAEYGHIETICGEQANERLEIETRSEIRAFQQDQRPAVFVAAHLSNFEVCAAAIRQMAGPVTVVYKPLKNPWLDRMLAGYRRRMGCNLVSSDSGPGQLLRELRAGRSIGTVIDQRHPAGTPISFFGVQKPTTIVPARLALRYGVELVPVRAQRLEGSRFRVTFYEPIPHGDPDEPEVERAERMTASVNAHFEQWIRECPQDWVPMRFTKGADKQSRAPAA
jgi:KDO2-lipid IV(A) lauroyltransferase